MTTLDWPSHAVLYEYPFFSVEANQRWQSAIDAGLAQGALVVDPLDHGLTHLHGACPRCGHHMAQSLYFEWVGPGVAPPTFNVVCDCREGHRHPDSAEPGCGWALELVVAISAPEEK